MDSGSDSKRTNVEDDRLSGLQDDLIIKILSFAGTKDAIGTSMLSSKWRHMWTSIPRLSFSSEDFPTLDKLSDFFTRVLSRRINNQVQLSSVKLYLCGNDRHKVAQRMMSYVISLNVEQVNIRCWFTTTLFTRDLRFTLSLPSSQDLKHLTLGCGQSDSNFVTTGSRFNHITLTSTGTAELSSLTTLRLDYITLYDDGVFSKCPNLENLTLNSCKMTGSKDLRIFHPQLSSLTLENTAFLDKRNVIVATPQLRNLTILKHFRQFQISAPQLASLLFKGFAPPHLVFSTDGFYSLEKARVSLQTLRNSHAPEIISLLQELHNVKVLSLGAEIIQLLNSSVELISQQSSPFTNLESLNILPKAVCRWNEHTRVVMSTEVEKYLLKGSPKATLTEVLGEHCCEAKRRLAKMPVMKFNKRLERKY